MILMKTQMLVDEAIEELQRKINDTAIIACSGGIDSSVAAVFCDVECPFEHPWNGSHLNLAQITICRPR